MERIRLMRVGLNVEQLLYRAPGGIGRYTAKLAGLLPLLFPDDTIVTFTAHHSEDETNQAYQRFGLDQVGVSPPLDLPLPRALLYQSWHMTGLPRLGWLSPALRGLDVIHAPSVAVPPSNQARLVVTIHDLAPLLFPETFPPRGRRFHVQGIRAAARRAALVITVSEAASAEILEHTPIPAERLRVVPNGVDLLQADEDTVAETLARRGLSRVPYVLWVGSLEPRKNVGMLVAAFSRLLAAEPDLPHRLVLAGPLGWLHDRLLPAGDQEVLGDRLQRLGRVSETELRALYAGAELFAFPSRHEGFGLPVLEAMAQGTPVLCADIPALVEVSGGAARLVKGDEIDAWVAALGELLRDPTARATLGRAGRQRAAHFDWERSVRATRAVYEEALELG
jgi:glycosyltransferase involved in cell wall biosynthesis